MRRALLLLVPPSLCAAVFAACSDKAITTTQAGAGGQSPSTVTGNGIAAASSGHGGMSSASSAASTATVGVVTATSGAGGGDGGKHYCDLPGSRRFTANGIDVKPGGPPGMPDISYITVPQNFCVHWFGHVGNARQLRFAPGGELFVASPTTGTTGGGGGGQSAIIVLPDADADGFADAPTTFLANLPSTQGLMFANGYFYYQDHTKIMRVPYKSGDLTPSGASALVADVANDPGGPVSYSSSLHWPKTLDQADDGTIYVGNGGDEGEMCDPAHPFHGGILKLDGTPGGAPVARGFRNPIAVRCQKGHNRCYATELAKDYSNNEGGREKLIPIKQGDDWGFPCCASKNLAYPGWVPVPDCSGTTADIDSFVIGDTPFGLAFEPGLWPAPYTNSAIVPLHGSAGSWYHAKVVAIAVDPVTGLPLAGDNLDGGASGALTDFAIGWDDLTQTHGRPAAVTFDAGGRLFLSNDNNGDIVWIAPLEL